MHPLLLMSLDLPAERGRGPEAPANKPHPIALFLGAIASLSLALQLIRRTGFAPFLGRPRPLLAGGRLPKPRLFSTPVCQAMSMGSWCRNRPEPTTPSAFSVRLNHHRPQLPPALQPRQTRAEPRITRAKRRSCNSVDAFTELPTRPRNQVYIAAARHSHMPRTTLPASPIAAPLMPLPPPPGYPSGLLSPPLAEPKPRPGLSPPGRGSALGNLPEHIIQRIAMSDYGVLIALRQLNTSLHHAVNSLNPPEESRIALVLQTERYFSRHRPRTCVRDSSWRQEAWGCFNCYTVLPVWLFSIDQPSQVTRLDLPGRPVVTPRRLCICCGVACGLYQPGQQIRYKIDPMAGPPPPAGSPPHSTVRETWICACTDVRAYLEHDYRVGLYACPRCGFVRPLSRSTAAIHTEFVPEVTFPTSTSGQSIPSSPVMAIDFVLSPVPSPQYERDDVTVVSV